MWVDFGGGGVVLGPDKASATLLEPEIETDVAVGWGLMRGPDEASGLLANDVLGRVGVKAVEPGDVFGGTATIGGNGAVGIVVAIKGEVGQFPRPC